MDNLVEMLREELNIGWSRGVEDLFKNAADEIERLRAENAQLNATLQLHDAGYGITDREIAQQLSKQIVTLKAELAEAVSAAQRLSEGQPFDAVVIADGIKRGVAAALKAQPAQSEPVAWQYRLRAKWVEVFSHWMECSKDQAGDYIKSTVINDWIYEVRALYTTPQPSAEVERDAALWKILKDWREDHVSDSQLCDYIDAAMKKGE
jgi:hypothetical protein